MTVGGGIIGGLIGGPMGASIGMTIGGMAGATLFGPTTKGPRLNDLKVTASTYGAVIPKGYGTFRIGGNMIWSDGIEETKKKQGGKGGPKQEVYYYFSTFAMSICEGPIDDILRIWADGKLIYDKSGGSSRFADVYKNIAANSKAPFISTTAGHIATLGKINENGKYKFRVYTGTEEQLPDSIMEAKLGVGNVSAHRGMAYIVFDRMALEDFGNRIPQMTFEVSKENRAIVPYMLSMKSDLSGPLLNKSTWAVDPSTGTIFAGRSGETGVWALDGATMKVIRDSDIPAFAHSPRQTFLPGEGLYIREIDATNSRRLQVYDLYSMSLIDTIGSGGGSVSGFFNPATGENQLSCLGGVNAQTVTTQSDRKIRLVMISGFRYTWVRDLGNGIPLFTDRAPFVPSSIFSGANNAALSETIGLRVSSGTIEMFKYVIGAKAEGRIEGNKWVQSTDWRCPTASITPFPGKTFTLKFVKYDPKDDTIFGFVRFADGTAGAFKYQWEEASYKWAKQYPDRRVSASCTHDGNLLGDTFGWLVTSGGNQVNEINLFTGELVREDSGIRLGDIGLGFDSGSHQYWDGTTASVITLLNNALSRVLFRTGTAGGKLTDSLKAICKDTKILTEADLDFSGLTEATFVGYAVDQQSTARDLLKQLGTAFFFEGFESDYKIKFRSRGSAPVVNITEDWAGRDNDGVAVKETMAQEVELPMRTSVAYYDVGRDHQQGTQQAKRTMGPIPSMWSAKETTFELPLSWTATDAKQCAEKLLKMSWANRFTYGLSLPWKYLKYDASDVVTFTKDDGTVYTMRIADATIGADFSLDVNGVSEKSAAYVSKAVGVSGDAPLQIITPNFPAKPIIINTPLLRDLDYTTSNNSVVYTSAESMGVFKGAAIMIDDGPLEFTTVGYVRNEGVTGYVLEALPATMAYESTDEDTELTILLTDAEATLESTTQEEMLTSYINAALVGDELIQFREAVLQANGMWKIKGILRARRGTNYAVKSHTKNERFVLLNETTIANFYRPPEQYVSTRTFKAVPPSTTSEAAEAYPVQLVPRDLMPLTPENVMITDDGTTVTITAQRRSRITAPLTDGYGVIHYKEGEKISARFGYQIWSGKTISEVDTGTDPSIVGTTALFDLSGNDITPTITFPLASLGTSPSFLLKVWEKGVVDGIPKWVEFKRMSQGDWNRVEAY